MREINEWINNLRSRGEDAVEKAVEDLISTEELAAMYLTCVFENPEMAGSLSRDAAALILPIVAVQLVGIVEAMCSVLGVELSAFWTSFQAGLAKDREELKRSIEH